MIVHDERFEELAKAPVKTTDVIVVRRIPEPFVIGEEQEIIDDVTAKWSSSDILMEAKIDIVGEMLGSATKKATVKLLGIVEDIVVSELFQVRLGIYDQDPSVSGFNYISEGHYLLEEIDYDYEAGSTTLIMYDHMWKAGNTLYTEAVGLDFITYPISVEDFATAILGILNITLDAGFSSLPNADYMIAEDLYSLISSATLKNVIQDIAGATGSTARMTDTVMHFDPYEVSDENLNSNELKTLKIGDTYGPVTSVILGRVPQNDNIALFASAPAANTVTAVNTTLNTLTIDDHGMVDGNMIRLQTTGTFPAPLNATTNYYIYTGGDPDVFKLAPTYDDGVAGTNLIDITSSGSGTLTVPTLATREIRINNNEVLDDDRETLLPPLYNALSGIEWSDVKADTVGLGWHEVGDVIQFTQGALTVKAFLLEIHLVLAGSIKEQLVSKIPDVATINYAAAGGITKSIFNTEIKVDKQAQEIISVVSRQDTLEGLVNQNFSEISQDVDDVLITIQRAGGGNILYNSVGFAKEQFRDVDDMAYDKLLYWTYPTSYEIDVHGSATSYQSSDSQAAGGISGQVIELKGNMVISQRVTVGAGVPLCFALMVKNTIGTGDVTITLENDTDSFEIVVDDTATYNWQEFKIEGFEATLPWLDVTITATSATKFLFTDLRLMYGTTTQGWVQANGEILSANVQFTTDGVRVFDSVHDTETRMTFNEFSTRSKTDNTILFEADDQGVLTNNLTIKGRTSYMRDDEVIVKQLTVGSSNPKSGLAFIRVV